MRCNNSKLKIQNSKFPMLNLYDKLREIPLFQGLTSDNLMQIIGQTKFSFKKFGKNDIIKKEGEKCDNVAILLSGDVTHIAPDDGID